MAPSCRRWTISPILHLITAGLIVAAMADFASAQTSLTAIGREGDNNRTTFLDSVSGSQYSTPANGLMVWCVNAGIAGAAYYAAANPDSPALTYRVVDFSTVSADAASYYDPKGFWPDYPAGADTFGRWAEAAFEYAYTYESTFRDLVAADGYVFESHFMQSIVSEISHESFDTFGVTIDSKPNRGNIFGGEGTESLLVDAYFSWMKTGTATLDGHTWTNSGALYSADYDNPEVAVLYLDRDHSQPGFELTQDYITFVAVPEPSSAILISLGGMAAALRRRRR